MELDKLSSMLHELYEKQDSELISKFARSLPFADGMFDRWERAKRLGFGEGASIYNSALVFGNVEVGDNSWIGPQVILDGSGGGISIGVSCSISAGVHIYTHDTVMWALSGGRMKKRQGSVTVGDCCYIGAQSIIAAGVKVGNRCLVAANSFVNRDIPEGTIVGGTPARFLGKVSGSGEEVQLLFGEKETELK